MSSLQGRPTAFGGRAALALRLSVTLSVLVLSMAGCSQTPEPEPTTGQEVTLDSLYDDAMGNGYTDAAAALEDRQITREELDSAVTQFGSCLADDGLKFDFIGTNPVDGWRPVYDVFWPGMNETNGQAKAQQCSGSLLDPVVFGYELSNEEEMQPSLMADVLSCLNATSYEAPAETRNLEDLIPLGAEDPNFDPVIDCVHQA